jgi:hypothetical protein
MAQLDTQRMKHPLRPSLHMLLALGRLKAREPKANDPKALRDLPEHAQQPTRHPGPHQQMHHAQPS